MKFVIFCTNFPVAQNPLTVAICEEKALSTRREAWTLVREKRCRQFSRCRREAREPWVHSPVFVKKEVLPKSQQHHDRSWQLPFPFSLPPRRPPRTPVLKSTPCTPPPLRKLCNTAARTPCAMKARISVNEMVSVIQFGAYDDYEGYCVRCNI